MAHAHQPHFWRDPLMPYVELRVVEDGRQVGYARHSHTQWSLGAVTAGESTFHYLDDEYLIHAGHLVLMNPTGCTPAILSTTSPGPTACSTWTPSG